MKELQDIIAIWKQLQERQTVAIATLVKVAGSTYRRPGARMLIAPDTQVGSLSGGCLESDVLERAQSVIENGCPVLVEYDTTADDDLIWGLGLGCQGVATVLIERSGDEPNALSVIARCLSQRQPGALATVFQGEGNTIKPGDRLLWFPDGEVNHIQNAELAQCVRQDLRVAVARQTSTVQKYQLSQGTAEVFLEVIQPPTALVIFGGGFDAVPLVRFAKELGWHVTVVDPKARPTTVERFSTADRVVLGFSEITNQIIFDEHTVAVMMTHNYLYDLELLQRLLPLSLTYLGILGPKQRTARLFAELQFDFEPVQHLYSPVGLDIGADNPQEIALAIAAEIQAVLQKRPGGFLKERNGSIHSRSEQDGSENFSRTYEAVKQ